MASERSQEILFVNALFGTRLLEQRREVQDKAIDHKEPPDLNRADEPDAC